MSFVDPKHIDWLAFPSPADIHVPHPDLFEFELDNIAGTDHSQLQSLSLDFGTDPFLFLRPETPACGPPSTITVSSESTYDDRSSHAGSYYYPHSPTFSNYSSLDTTFPADLTMNFASFNVDADNAQAVAAVPQQVSNALGLVDANADYDAASFGELPPLEYDSSSSTGTSSHPPDIYSLRRSDLVPAPQSSSGTSTASSVSPVSIPQAIPHLHLPMSSSRSGASESDPRRKYACPSCPRAFARAYNLKTHMATHDPHRTKPHSCPHMSCGRSFSRKHDLHRHLISIHRDEPLPETKIGLSNKAQRGWCDDCGKGWTGAAPVACACQEIK